MPLTYVVLRERTMRGVVNLLEYVHRLEPHHYLLAHPLASASKALTFYSVHADFMAAEVAEDDRPKPRPDWLYEAVCEPAWPASIAAIWSWIEVEMPREEYDQLDVTKKDEMLEAFASCAEGAGKLQAALLRGHPR